MALGFLAPYRRQPSAFGGRNSLLDLHRQVNGLFEEFFGRDDEGGSYRQFGMTAPPMEVHQDDRKVEITAELPGVDQDDVELTVEDGMLILRGEKKNARTDKERGYTERSYGSFERRVTLPPGVDVDKCSADFDNGVLTVSLPLAEQARGRRIPLGRSTGEGRDKPSRLIDGKAEDKTKQKELETA